MQVNKGNVFSINHAGNTLTVVFASSTLTYEYTPVSKQQFNVLEKAAKVEGSEEFKKEFNAIKNNPNIAYKKI